MARLSVIELWETEEGKRCWSVAMKELQGAEDPSVIPCICWAVNWTDGGTI